MSTRQFSLIRKDYCHRWGIKDVDTVTFAHLGVNRITGNQLFTVTLEGFAPVTYEHIRVDIAIFSQQRSLRLPKDTPPETLVTKAAIASWLNKHLNLGIFEGDIGVLSVDREKLSVIIGPNSMRFQGTLFIYFL